jgi:hypothetical protein
MDNNLDDVPNLDMDFDADKKVEAVSYVASSKDFQKRHSVGGSAIPVSKATKAKIEEMTQKERARRAEADRKMDEAREKIISDEKSRWEKAALDPTLIEL